MFVQVIEAKTTDPSALRQRIEAWQKDVMPGAIGFVGSTGGVTDEGRLFVMARFESAAQAARNATRPEQDAWWRSVEPLLTGVTFRESEDVQTIRNGGSDTAGFVQVIEGRATDRKALEAVENEMMTKFADARPDFLGGLRAWFDGGAFVETAYFPSEQEARAGESAEPPAELQATMQGWKDSTTDLTYLDLREPWFTSA